MRTRTVTLPFARTVSLVDPHPGTGARQAIVIDDLTVTLPDLTDGGQAVREVAEGHLLGVRHVVAGRSYAPVEDGAGLDAVAASRRIRRLIMDGAHRTPSRRIHDGEALAGLAVLDDGRGAQESQRSRFEANSVMVNGLLMRLAATPRIELRLTEEGRVRIEVPLLAADGSRMHADRAAPPAWQVFPLDAPAEARAMALALASAGSALSPSYQWGTHWPTGVQENLWRRWEVDSPQAFAELRHADGGPGSREEREAAMASDLARIASDCIGHYPTAAVRAFADLRDALDQGAPVGEPLLRLADSIDAVPWPKCLDARSALSMRVAVTGLRIRLDLDPAPGSAPRAR